MRQQLARIVLFLLSMLLVSGLAQLLAAYTTHWPRINKAALRVSMVATAGSLFLLLAWGVLFLLRFLNWPPGVWRQ
jgi:hypothetical protein